ncbi:MAG: carboxypeptidase-like regulatory domain-containing protein, partial [Chitinophagales bacterium]|nr:carboxypeptidase-like regulatory domain-containing protein [Chitinophagales bacterium]
VVSTDSAATPVAFASIYNRELRQGTIANHQGFFSFAARIGDTIEISSVGYKNGLAVVPDIANGQAFTALVFLQPEVSLLPEARVYPWLSKEQFRQAFINIPIPEDDLERARKNLDPQTLLALGENLHDANIIAKQSLNAYSATYYYQGQYQPQTILSPTAWMQFFDALNKGLFKK